MNKLTGKLVPVVLTLLLSFFSQAAFAAACDVDADGDVDRNDIGSIYAARNTPASGSDDPRDANGDGLITVQDGRMCVRQCTLASCAVVTPDGTPPQIGILSPANGAVLSTSAVAVSGTASDNVALSSVTVNGIAAVFGGGTFNVANLPLAVGSNNITALATDTSGNSASASIQVTFAPNNPPVIVSTPGTSATEGQLYSYDVDANDADGDVPTYSLDVAPAGMSINVTSGLIQWTPSGAQLGANAVTVRANDGNGGVATQSFSIDVAAALVLVPSVVGLSQATAESDIVAAGLTVGTVTTQNSDTVPAGDVISQNPSAGTSVTTGAAVDLVVSLGPTLIITPNVVGLSQATAESDIVAAGLTVGTVTTQNSDTVPAGDVISQNPSAGTSVTTGAAVDLVVSLGPTLIITPNVVGLSQATAESDIVAAGLTVGTVTTQNSDTVPAGDVISQNPSAGTSVTTGAAVDLVVSLGPTLIITPNVVGLSQAAAESDIVAAGLTVGTVTTQNSDTVPAGDVISQNPSAGTSVTTGAAVDLVVSLGPTLIITPNVVGLSQATAESDIVAAGLTVGTVTTQNSDTVPAGDVISQNPSAGTSVTTGAAVDLVVSLGPTLIITPNVVGLSQATAESDIVAAGLTVGTVTTQNSDTVPAGDVISQNPSAGTSVTTGAAVDLVVSLGPTLIITPNVVGLSQATAESDIVAAGLTVGTVTTQNSDTVPAGDVISQNPSAGTSVTTGAAVDLVVSLGPTLIITPNVVGLSQATAESDIVAAGLTVGTVTTQNSDTVPAGDVISQNPSAGTSVTTGAAVDLVVSLGPTLIITPNVVGLSQAAAESDIVAAGLTVGTISTQFSDTVPAGDVISQLPLAGVSVTPGTAVDLFVSSGPPASAQLNLSSNVVPTQGAGGSVDADCQVLDSNDQPTGLPVDLTTSDPTAVITGGTNFAFPNVGEFSIDCAAIGFVGVTDSDTVAVMDDAVNPVYSALGGSLTRLEQLHGDTLVANEADDIPGLQAAKDALLAEIASVDLAALAAAPPVPTGGDVPSAAELLAAGDAPDPVIDVPYVSTIQDIRQNMTDYAALLASVNTSTITQGDVDAMNALTAAADALASTLEGLEPSNTAILSVNTELNDIVSNLLPNQSVNVAQLTADAISTAPGIVYLDWKFDPLRPDSLFAGLQQDSRGPAGYYAEPQKAFGLIGLMTSTSIANSLRSRYIKTVYKPIMKHIAGMMNFLRTQDLGPFGLNPPVLDFVFGNGSGTSTIFEGGFIQVWGSGFDPVAANNTIEVQSQNGTFTSAGVVVQKDAGGFDIMDSGFFPGNMGNHPFGLPDVGVVRVITSGGTSNGITVNIFR